MRHVFLPQLDDALNTQASPSTQAPPSAQPGGDMAFLRDLLFPRGRAPSERLKIDPELRPPPDAGAMDLDPPSLQLDPAPEPSVLGPDAPRLDPPPPPRPPLDLSLDAALGMTRPGPVRQPAPEGQDLLLDLPERPREGMLRQLMRLVPPALLGQGDPNQIHPTVDVRGLRDFSVGAHIPLDHPPPAPSRPAEAAEETEDESEASDGATP